MKRYSLILWAVAALSAFTACNEETVQPFSAEAGINFLEPAGSSSAWTEGYTGLSYAIDFMSIYEKGSYGVEDGTFTLRVALEGRLSDIPYKVRFKVEPVEGYDTPVISVPSEATEIAAGEYTADAVFSYQKPEQYNTTYRAYIVFDYENSDVVAGTKERQKFLVEIKNAFDYTEDMYVSTMEEWEEVYEPILGKYGEEKMRFLIAVLTKLRTTLEDAAYYTYYYPSYAQYYGLQGYMQNVRDALNEYNAEHPDAPVREADGTPVTFPEPENEEE